MKPEDLENEIAALFKEAGFEQPTLEARQLLKEIGEPRDLEGRAREWAKHRIRGVPLAYLSGRKGFYKHEFAVRSGVLVPRPETEHVIEEALRRSSGTGLKVTEIADLGSGSGCLGLSILGELPAARLMAVDVSQAACDITAQNARELGLESRAEILNQTVESVEVVHPRRFELIVANPPYIAMGDPEVQASVHAHEPHLALYSGADGLDAIRAWVPWAARHLCPGGIFVCEIGSGQSRAVREIMTQAGFDMIEIKKDLAGHDRVVSGVLVAAR